MYRPAQTVMVSPSTAASMASWMVAKGASPSAQTV